MRTIYSASILLVVTACQTDPGFEYVPAEPELSKGAVCESFPLGIGSPGWFNDAGVELSSTGVLGLGDGPGLHKICGTEENDRLFKVEQALIFDKEYEKQTGKTRYHVCTGTIARSEKKHHPDATVTIALSGHKACDDISGTYGHKTKPAVAAKEPTTPCERYTACVCAISAAKDLDTSHADGVGKLCREAKDLLAGTEQDDSSCKGGLAMMQKTAPAAYKIALPGACK